MQRSLPLTFASTLLVASICSAAPVPLTTCGQTVSEAVLTGDLDCSSTEGFAVTLSPGGSIDLAGYTLTGGIGGGGVFCLGDCTVVGGGGSILAAVDPEDDFHSTGVEHPLTGLRPFTPEYVLDVSGVTISGHSSGISGAFLVIRDCEITGAYTPYSGKGVDISTSLITGNRNGGGGRTLRMSDTIVTGNDNGPSGRRVEVRDSSVYGNQGTGMTARGLRMTGSQVEGNCLSPSSSHCYDVKSDRRPRLTTTDCGTSARWTRDGDWVTWGVCALD